MSINVNGIAEKRKRQLTSDYLRKYHADIYLLQETHNVSDHDEQTWTQEWGGSCIWSRGSNRSCGVGILLKPGLDGTIASKRHDNDGRVVSMKCIYKDQELNIINVYAPTIPQEHKDFMETIWNFKTGDTNLILAGDFNCVEDPTYDKLGGNPTSGTVGLEELLNFTSNHDLTDIWRAQHPGDRIYMWSNCDFTLRSRLDRWYIPKETIGTATSCIRACPHSDHSTVEVVFGLTDSRQRGKGVWKFNNTLLDDKAFGREITYVYSFWKACANEYPDKLEWWDEVKAHFKKVAITHSVRKIRNREKLETSLRFSSRHLKTNCTPM